MVQPRQTSPGSRATPIVKKTKVPKKDHVRVAESVATEFGGPTAKVIVGHEEEVRTFWISETLLCTRSTFFKKALSEHWKEGQDRVVELEDEDPEVFALYMCVLHRNKVPVSRTSEEIINGEGTEKPTTAQAQDRDNAQSKHREDAQHEQDTIANIYVLSEFLGDIVSKNLLVDAMIESCYDDERGDVNYFPYPSTIHLVYDGTSANNPMRKLLQDLWIMEADTRWFKTKEDTDVPKDFLVRVLKGLAARSTTSSGTSLRGKKKYYE